MSLLQELRRLRSPIAAMAQEVLDDWTGDGEDPVLGSGGACDRIAEAMGWIVEASADAEVEEGGQDGDDHAWLVVIKGDERCGVDIPASVYETGGGYSWRKKKGVQLTTNDVAVWKL